jgi:hypothetical protein
MRIAVFCSASDNLASSYYEKTAELGRWIGKNGHSILYGGSAQGLMECIAKSVKEAGGETIGVLPLFMFDHGLASKMADQIILTKDLTERKNKIMNMADAFLALPGGFGTLDEVFHVVASAQVGYHNKKVVMYSINGFYDHIRLQMERAFDERFTPIEYRGKLVVVDSLSTCVNELCTKLSKI